MVRDERFVPDGVCLGAFHELAWKARQMAIYRLYAAQANIHAGFEDGVSKIAY